MLAYMPSLKPVPAIPETEILAALRRAIEKAGSLRAYARKIGVSAPYLSDVLRGRRSPGPRLLTPLGFSVHVEVHHSREYSKL